MEARHEIIPFTHTPVRLFMHKLGSTTRHWHESVELLFVLSGNATVFTGSEHTVLERGDMFLINRNVVHELHSEACVLIAVQFKLSKFSLPPEVAQSLYFDCNSRSGAPQSAFGKLKQIIAAMLRTNVGGGEAAMFRYRTLAYELLTELTENFRGEKPASEANTQKHLERLNSILSYVKEHYREQLTLNQLADREHLSAPYLSSFFEKYMGINFSTYYTDLRLEYAVSDLVHTDIPIEQIAMSNGFADTRAFLRAFKKRYGMVPSAYRKNSTAALPLSEDPLLTINYLDFKPENYLHILNEYLPQEADASAPTQQLPTRALPIGAVDVSRPGRRLEHKWRTLIGVGRAKELLYADVQDMLRRLQREVGFRYVRFHGIFSDDMLVCRADRSGALHFSFSQVDLALDFLLSIGLKPVIQLSFMPAAMAADPGHTIFASPFTISSPRRMEDWNRLVLCFLDHIRSRYGVEEIRSWLYTPWNEPDTSREMFAFESLRQFYDFYENTWRTVKAFDPQLVFGSPSLFPITPANVEWMREFLRFAQGRGCAPEFLSVHYYSDNFHKITPEDSKFESPSTCNGDPDHFGKFLTAMQTLLTEEGMEHLPLYISEWNLTVSHRSLINDTCFKACYLVKNFLENYDRVDALGYWSLTDFLEEYQAPEELFHGGMGLFTRNGIKKPACYAMEMMCRLGDELIAAGEGYFVTRGEGGICALLYHYEHYDPLFVEEGFGMTDTYREGVFRHPCQLEIDLTLTGLRGGSYWVRETILNREHGSCFDSWVAMGAPELSDEDAQWLRQTARPRLHLCRQSASGGELPYHAVLTPHEVRLVEITPVSRGLQNRSGGTLPWESKNG